MAKVRVHEIAKELGVENKEVIEFLAGKGIDAKAQSGLEEDIASSVRNNFKKPAPAPKAEAPKAEAPKAEAPKAAPAAKPAEPVKKKKNITVVFNNHNSKDGRDNRGRDNRDNNRDNRDNNRDNREVSRGPIKPRTNVDGLRPSQRHAVVEEEPVKTAPVVEEPKPVVENTVSKPVETTPEVRPNVYRNVYKDNPQAAPSANRDNRDNRDRNNGNKFNNGNKPNQGKGQGNRPNNGNRPDNGFKKDGGNKSIVRHDDRRTDRPSQGGRPNSAHVDAPEPNSNNNNRRENNNKKKQQQYNNRDKNPKNQENFINLEKNGGKKKHNNTPKPVERGEDEILTITLPEHLTIKELADKMKVLPAQVIKKLFMKGQMVTLNSDVSYEEAEEIALEFNCICEQEEKVDVIAELLKEEDEDDKNLVTRPPVVCVMGHVDHGKTSLLDAIRDTKVTSREAGGITQHIGAYVVSINNQDITFLDTPGHEAFTAMRMRGANSTDIAILVVAADDGVMPQTVEAINHAKAAGVEIIVAINKIDKPNANIDRVKQELAEYQLIPEDWGGSTVFVPVSAHTKEGIDTLLEMILLTAEVLELKSNPKRNARGLVIEAQLDKGRGAVATVLVQKGTLHVGDPVACGSCYGKVRAMLDDTGLKVTSAGPSVPVEILGLSDVPNAGEIFVAMDSEKEARSFAETFISESKNRLIEETKSKMSLDDLFSQIQSGNVKELNIIVKADVQGSVEAVKQSLEKLSNEEVVVKIIHGGVGAINESDVILASASNAIIIGFNIRPDAQAKATADREGVDVRLYRVIYDAIEDVEAAMKGMLDPVFEEKVTGHAIVRQTFKASGVGIIAGSYVTDGYFTRDCSVRISREGTQIFEGKLASLKRFKDDVKEVKTGYECGIVVEDYSDFKEDDIIEAYTMVEVPR